MEPRCKIRKLTNRKAPQITKVENQNLRASGVYPWLLQPRATSVRSACAPTWVWIKDGLPMDRRCSERWSMRSKMEPVWITLFTSCPLASWRVLQESRLMDQMKKFQISLTFSVQILQIPWPTEFHWPNEEDAFNLGVSLAQAVGPGHCSSGICHFETAELFWKRWSQASSSSSPVFPWKRRKNGVSPWFHGFQHVSGPYQPRWPYRPDFGEKV